MIELMSQADIDADPAAWLAKRRDLITGSDIAGIAGDPDAYRKPTAVYLSKVAGIGEPDSMAMLFGRHAEGLIADIYAGSHPDVHPGYLSADDELLNPGLCVSDTLAWQGATLDRVERLSGAVVEIKQTVRRGEFGTPPHGAIPLRHHIQALWEADVAGADLVKLAVWTPPYGPLAIFWIVIDAGARVDQAWLRERAYRFREDHLLPQRPPPVDGSESTTLALKSYFSAVERETVVVPKRLWADALAAERRLDAAKERLALAKNRIAEAQGNAEFAVTRDGQRVMQRSLSWPARVDLTALRARYSEAAAACTRKPPADEPEVRFLLKQPKGK